jgi:hypothetical protein
MTRRPVAKRPVRQLTLNQLAAATGGGLTSIPLGNAKQPPGNGFDCGEPDGIWINPKQP